MNELEYGTIFEKGVPNPFGEYFSGQSYLAMLTQLNGMSVANVTFEPACRNSWHIHHGEKGGGQIGRSENMRKVLVLMLGILMVFSLAACGAEATGSEEAETFRGSSSLLQKKKCLI